MATGEHVCPIKDCGKGFSKPSRLTIHIRTHTGERPFVCPYENCFKSYARQQHLKRHEEISHNSKVDDTEESHKPSYSCTIDGCEATFPSKHSLNRHIQRIHLKAAYKCPAIGCSEVFKKHQQLKTHYAMHQEENPYKCPVDDCGKSFPFPNKLKGHMKTHEGYRCEQEGCEAVFYKWTLLRKHRVVHHAEYRCPVCSKCFAQKQWLKEHSLVHSEKRPVFDCPYSDCQREYLCQRNLNAHIKTYHDKKRFECEESGCGRTFATKQKLQQHRILHDPDRPLRPTVKRKKKTVAQKLTGVTMETEDRGESGDDLMTSVDINNDLELTDLQLTSGCHGNGDMGRSNNIVTDSTSCETSLKNSKQSVLSSLCLKTETCNIITNANNVPNLEKNI